MYIKINRQDICYLLHIRFIIIIDQRECRIFYNFFIFFFKKNLILSKIFFLYMKFKNFLMGFLETGERESLEIRSPRYEVDTTQNDRQGDRTPSPTSSETSAL